MLLGCRREKSVLRRQMCPANASRIVAKLAGSSVCYSQLKALKVLQYLLLL